MGTPSAVPTFRFEENRLLHSLRVLAYPGDTFTSEECVRCAFAVTAVRRGDRTPPKHETNLDEWSRVLDLLLAAEPSVWVRNESLASATDARIAEVHRWEKSGRGTQH